MAAGLETSFSLLLAQISFLLLHQERACPAVHGVLFAGSSRGADRMFYR
jgi:hypothetical protein